MRMNKELNGEKSGKTWLSLDGWAVLAAFVAALLIRTGVFKHVPW
jgi:hypothetical protein